MKCKELKKLSKMALIKRLKTAERKNWTLLGQIARQEQELGEALAYNLVIDEMFSQSVQQNLVKIEELEAKIAQYQAQFGDLPDDDTAKNPQERGKIERKQKDGELMQRRVCRGFLHINNQRYFDEVLQELDGELLAVRDTGDGYEVYRANNLLCQFDKIATNKE